jgi:membrane protein implicated in regulation of membrane protease activity
MTTEELPTSPETQSVSWSALWSLLWRSVLLLPFGALIFTSHLLIPAGIVLALNEAILFATKALWWHASICVIALIALTLLGRFLFRRKRSLPPAEPSREGACL